MGGREGGWVPLGGWEGVSERWREGGRRERGKATGRMGGGGAGAGGESNDCKDNIKLGLAIKISC